MFSIRVFYIFIFIDRVDAGLKGHCPPVHFQIENPQGSMRCRNLPEFDMALKSACATRGIGSPF